VAVRNGMGDNRYIGLIHLVIRAPTLFGIALSSDERATGKPAIVSLDGS